MQQPTNNCTVLFSHVAPLSNIIDAACCYYPSYPPPYPQQKAQAQWQWQSANWNKKQKRETKRRKQEARGGGVSVRVRVSLGFFAPQEKLGARLRTTPYTINILSRLCAGGKNRPSFANNLNFRLKYQHLNFDGLMSGVSCKRRTFVTAPRGVSSVRLPQFVTNDTRSN